MTELRKSFHGELAEVHGELMRIGAQVIEAIPRATRVLLEMDLEGADLMIQGDDEIDSRCIDVEEQCYRILALQSPVASDLRAIITALKLTSEIERSGDLAVNICKAARRIYGHELNPKLRGLITKMGEQAQQLFASAMEAYDESDAAKAAAVDDMDNFLDDLQRQFVQVIFESHSAGSIDLQVAVQLAVVARFYERIGDHAVNIGEKVRYLVSGWLPEHVGAVRHRLRQDPTPVGGIPMSAPGGRDDGGPASA